MSRFFAKSDSESETSSSDDEVAVKPVQKTYIAISDDDDDTKRVVKSTKEKKYEDLNNIIKHLKNHKKIKDMAKVLNDFEELGKAFDKARKVIEKEGIPKFFIKCLSELEDFVNMHWEDSEGRKQLSKNKSKGLTALRQKLKKYNKTFEDKISAYRENPDQGDSEQEKEEEDKEEEEEAGGKIIIKPTEEQEKRDQDTDDEMWGGSSSSSTDSSDDDIKPLNQLNADYFRKKTTETDEALKKKKKEKEERKKEVVRKAEMDSDDAVGGWEKVGSSAVDKPEIFSKETEITEDLVKKKLFELTAGRGRKGTDRSLIIDLLIELKKITQENNLGQPLLCKILFFVITSIFDYNQSLSSSMKSELWERCLRFIKELLEILLSNQGNITIGDHISEENENYIGPTGPYSIKGCLITLVERMDEEFLLMLQACDAHSTDYIERLKDETQVCGIIGELEKYIFPRASADELCRIYYKKIQHLYYKFDPKSYGTSLDTLKSPEGSRQLMDTLCKFIYSKDTTDLLRTRAILSHIYHHALHDRFYEARDLMLMSHLQDNILGADVPTQILYNRALVQLGLCAFRQGMIKDAHNCLVDIQSSRRARELLAQGLLIQRQMDRTPEQEKLEKRRQMPYHMYINLELLECVYLVSAMLIEIPNMAAHEFEARKRMISKNFHYVLRESDKQTLVGPPENMREHVVAACKAMRTGNWKNCFKYIVNEKMNAKVWDLFSNSESVKKMIEQKIQEETLRTYLFSYSNIYDSLDLQALGDMFNLSVSTIHSITSKMIISDELMASIDGPSQTLEMHRTEPTYIQSLALQLSDKLSQVVEHNEKLLEMKTNGLSFFAFQPRVAYGQGQFSGYQSRDNQQQNYQGRRQTQKGRESNVRFNN